MKTLRQSPGFAFQIGLALLLALGAHGANAQDTPAATVTVDLPHGGCRLSIRDDGEASLSYGSMPRWVRVAPGTFDFDHVVELLDASSSPQGDRPFDSAATGTVSLPGSQALRLVDDAGLVRSLLEKAWRARLAPADDSTAEDHDWVANACAFAQ